MKAESNVKPSEKFVLENYVDGNVDIVFFDDVKKEERKSYNEEGKEICVIVYVFQLYRITVRNRETLKLDVENNYEKYLKEAVQSEYNILAQVIRDKRDKLLADTDWTQMGDIALSQEKQEKYKIYRQNLRDVTKQEGFPYTVEFPTLESEG